MQKSNPAFVSHSPSFPQDRFGVRVRWAVGLSIVLNLCFWRIVATLADHTPPPPPERIEISRVILDKQERKTEKVAPRKVIAKVVRAGKEGGRTAMPTPLRPTFAPANKFPLTPQTLRPTSQAAGGYNRGSTSSSGGGNGTGYGNGDGNGSRSGGGVSLGTPLGDRTQGNEDTYPPMRSRRQNNSGATQKPESTRDAEPIEVVNPQISDDLRDSNFKTFVQIRVEVGADESFHVSLLSSSGNSDIDGHVLNALTRWHWRPALKNNVPVSSVQVFRYDFLRE